MDGYFVTPPPPVMQATFAPVAVPSGNYFQVNSTLIYNFWSIRDLWLEERWTSQSETACAALMAQVQPPAYTPHGSSTPVVMFSW